MLLPLFWHQLWHPTMWGNLHLLHVFFFLFSPLLYKPALPGFQDCFPLVIRYWLFLICSYVSRTPGSSVPIFSKHLLFSCAHAVLVQPVPKVVCYSLCIYLDKKIGCTSVFVKLQLLWRFASVHFVFYHSLLSQELLGVKLRLEKKKSLKEKCSVGFGWVGV